MNAFFSELFHFFSQNLYKIGDQLLVHIGITFISLFLSIFVALPLGVFLSKFPKLAPPILSFASILQTIPSIALLGLMIPILGIGLKPAVFVLFLYALLPILRNTYTGISQVDGSVKEAALAMGMTPFQVLWKVELPLAIPIIFAGIRIATVINVGVATLAAYIGAGGLGEFIFGGISLNNPYMMLGGAIPAALLAIFLDYLLSKAEFLNLSKSKNWFWGLILLAGLSGLYEVPRIGSGKILAGLTPEFYGRKDGYLGLKSIYQLKLNYVIISDAIMYKAIRDGDLDLISGYSTDGRIRAYHLMTLVDNRHIFPPYQAAPLISTQWIRHYPILKEIIQSLSGKINDSIMTELNFEVDFKKKDPNEVALEFLKRNHLFKKPLEEGSEKFIIGSKIFPEQYILSAMYASLIRGNTHLKVITKTGLGGTQVCFNALVHHEIDMYPEYTGTGLLVILKPSEKVLGQLNSDPQKVFQYVQDEFSNKFQLNWLQPIGFNNSYCLVMRKGEIDKENIHSIEDLARFIKSSALK